jgi:cation diffusion facilitator family transporter
MTKVVQTAFGSVVVACLVLALKLGAWWLSDSVALLADALESVVNVAAALAALAALIYASRPPDANHPYGHTKAEYLSAVLEGALIVIAAVSILREAGDAWFVPRLHEQPGVGLAISALATVLNLLWALVLFRRGRTGRSRHCWRMRGT